MFKYLALVMFIVFGTLAWITVSDNQEAEAAHKALVQCPPV